MPAVCGAGGRGTPVPSDVSGVGGGGGDTPVWGWGGDTPVVSDVSACCVGGWGGYTCRQ